jgi:phosphatidylglycerol lysyltransferase
VQRRDPAIILVAALTLANGGLGILHSLFARLHAEPVLFSFLLPYGVHHWSKHLTLATGVVLVDLSYHLYRRRRAAWWLATLVLAIAAMAHLGRGHHPLLAIAPGATLVLLVSLRRRFSVRSEPHSIAQGLMLVGASLLAALLYGAAGFWLLDPRDFDLEFTWRDALVRSFREYTLAGPGDLMPHTRHARWFLDSLQVMGTVSVGFAVFSLYRPLAFRLRTLPQERERARRIVEAYGRSSLDYFKTTPDKSFFFGLGDTSVIAYRTAWGVAVTLGDPVGPAGELEALIRGFLAFAADNGWRVAFHQTLPDLLPLYEKVGLSVLKVGEEALIDLKLFTEKTCHASTFRRVANRAKTLGLQVTYHEPPYDATVLNEVHAVSDEWLTLPGRRERGFTLGTFTRDYVAATPLYVCRDSGGLALAFVNIILCWPPGDATIDLMRHRVHAPNSTMDFMFVETLSALAARGARRFSLGLAPLAGVGDRPGASLEERAVHQLYERLNRFFSYKGLRNYKAKFEPAWEERFLAYQGGPPGLVNTAIALTRITED